MNREEYIDKALNQFRELLTEQLERNDRMKNATAPKDFSAVDRIVIGLCGGDGIGPIIMEQAERLVRKVLAEELESGRVILKTIEGLTIENRLLPLVQIGWTSMRIPILPPKLPFL